MAMNATDGSFGGTSEGLSGTFGGAVIQVATGYNHTCALLANRTVECWGSNSAGRLGDGTTANRRTPVAVPGLSGVTAIAAGSIRAPSSPIRPSAAGATTQRASSAMGRSPPD